MYCTYCNHPNVEGNKFCESCGKPLKVQQSVLAPVPQDRPATKASWARRLASVGSIIVLYSFFLPWLMVSCSLDVNGQSGLEVSGYEIASGDYQIAEDLNQLGALFGGSGYESSSTDAYPVLALIPIIALFGLISLNGHVSGSVTAILSGLMGMGGMTIFGITALAYGKKLNEGMIQLQFEEGYWGAWLGFIWLAVVAILTVWQRKR
jgi:hypothetical protein